MQPVIRVTDLRDLDVGIGVDTKSGSLVTTLKFTCVIHPTTIAEIAALQKGINFCSLSILSNQTKMDIDEPAEKTRTETKKKSESKRPTCLNCGATPTEDELKNMVEDRCPSCGKKTTVVAEEMRACGNCGHEFTIAVLAAQKDGKCPDCGRPFLPKEQERETTKDKPAPGVTVAPGTVTSAAPTTSELQEHKNGDGDGAVIPPAIPQCKNCRYIATKEELDVQTATKVCPSCNKPLEFTATEIEPGTDQVTALPPKKERKKRSDAGTKRGVVEPVAPA